ncbi:hypothetical protein E4U17_003424 [Claviceps sp. LM77 group G4]|nr:hypothetical protein E4U17_003424 [Claviceps sp. LM77 group G4]
MTQFYYVYSRLGTFQATFLPYVTRATDFNHQPAAFLTYISDTLGETHKERRAGMNLVKRNESKTRLDRERRPADSRMIRTWSEKCCEPASKRVHSQRETLPAGG